MFDKIKRRRAFPVDGLDGVFVRLLTLGEESRAIDLDKDLKPFFVMGKCLVDGDSTNECQQEEGEADIDFATRVKEEMSEADAPDVDLIGSAYAKLRSKGLLRTEEQIDTAVKN